MIEISKNGNNLVIVSNSKKQMDDLEKGFPPGILDKVKQYAELYLQNNRTLSIAQTEKDDFQSQQDQRITQKD